MKKTKYILLVAAMAATAAQAATPILWDINAASAGTDATSPWDFINAGVTEDVTSGTVEVIAGSSDIMWNAANDLSLDNVLNQGGTYNWGPAAGPIMADGCNGRYLPDSPMQISGLTNHLSASTAYKFYIWAHGDGGDQNASITFDGVTKTTPNNLEPANADPSNFVLVFNFTTGASVSNTLDFTWAADNKYTGLNGFAIVEDDESTPPVVDLPPNAPSAMYTVISNMAVEVKFSASTTGTEPITYNVKRSTESGSGYVTIGSTTNTVYVDTTVESNATYYYVVNAANAFGESADSDEATGVGLAADIISDHVSTYGAGSTLDNDNLFDNDIVTFYDTGSPNGGYVGLDYGTNIARQVMSVAYVLRNWSLSVGRCPDTTFEGANKADFSDAVILHTIPTSVSGYPSVNVGSVTNTTSFRYVRVKSNAARPLYFLAEIDFITADEVTAEGTWFNWLDSYYDIPGTNSGVYFADYAAADYSDTDGDGLLAWEEYQLNGDPTDANSPAGVNNLYAWPESPLENVVRWDATSLADTADGGGYIVYRSLDDITYEAVATIATNMYTDTDVAVNVAYYYKASVTNATYEHETVLSTAETAVPNQYTIIGVMNNSGASKSRWFYELFDADSNTFLDDNATGGYAGVDYGDSNGQAIEEVYFRLRSDSFGTGVDGTYNEIVVNGETVPANRAQAFVYGNTFEGSSDGTTWTVLATITNMVPLYGLWNKLPVTDAMTYQYVRYYPANGLNNFAMADVEFVSAGDYTAKGTPMFWLEENGLTAGDDDLDGDSDGHESWQEFLAYTDPNDSNSVLEVTSASLDPLLAITWQSIEGVTYNVVTNLDLVYGNPGTIASGITGLAGETSYTGTVSGVSGEDTVFYSIGVE